MALPALQRQQADEAPGPQEAVDAHHGLYEGGLGQEEPAADALPVLQVDLEPI